MTDSEAIEKNMTIIIPTLNEAENIGKLVKFIAENYKSQILVVDDGSTDGTINEVKKLQKNIKRLWLLDRKNEKMHGLTASVVEGIKKAKTKYFLVMDADFQHPPSKIKEFVELLRYYDLVVGRREKIKNWPLYRRLISFTLSAVGKFMLILRRKKYCSDILSGFFAGNEKIKNLVKRGKFVPEGYKVLYDILKQAENIKIGEVPYTFSSRKAGSSKAGIKQTIALLKSFLS